MGILDPAPGTKYSEVTDIWLLASKELIGCFVQKLMDVNMVDDVTCCINSFRPELSWVQILIQIKNAHINLLTALLLSE